MADRAYYSANIPDFLKESPDTIFAKIAKFFLFPITDLTKASWYEEIDILKSNLVNAHGTANLRLIINLLRIGIIVISLRREKITIVRTCRISDLHFNLCLQRSNRHEHQCKV